MENNENEPTQRMEFMRKVRFDLLRNKFKEISPEADKVISNAKPNDILKLALTFNSPVNVVEAEIFDEDKFAELAFS